MTKEEFYEYVKSFGKEPGHYTTSEMIQIGLKHKNELGLADKNWQELCDLLGWQGSKDSFRMYINHRKDSTSEEALREMDRLYVAKTQIRDTYNAYRRTLRDEARIEDLKDIIKEEVSKLPDLPKIKYEGKKLEKALFVEAIAPIADLHLGAEFKNSYNEYNLDIATSRLNELLDKTIKHCKEHKVNRLNIINMGDMISGKIHVTLRLENMTDAISQTMKAAEMLANFVNECQKAVPEITYRTVSDNHSRITDDKNQHIEKENLNRIIDWFIEERLKNTKVKFPKDNLDIGLGRFVLENGKKVFFSHGHQDKKSTVMQDMVGLTREFPDYILMAHYHNSAEHTFQGAKVFISGSIMGTDTYAYGKRLFGEPEQRLLIFEGKDLIDVEIKL